MLRTVPFLYDGPAFFLWSFWPAVIRNLTSLELRQAPVFSRVEILHQSFGRPWFSLPPLS